MVAIAVAGLLLGGIKTGAAQSPAVAIAGQVEHSASYSATDLAAAESIEVQGAREGGVMSRFTGPLLWPLLAAAKPMIGAERGARLQRVIVARGADGYSVVLAIGELDPNFEGKQVIIALTQDGGALAAPRLVVPGDKHAGRNVRDLVAVEVR